MFDCSKTIRLAFACCGLAAFAGGCNPRSSPLSAPATKTVAAGPADAETNSTSKDSTASSTSTTSTPPAASAASPFETKGSASRAIARPPGTIELSDVTGLSGVRFSHYSGQTEKHYLIETVSCGLATLDYDGDGRMDLYLPSGSPLVDVRGVDLGSRPVDQAPTNRLFRNLGNFRFVDVTEDSGAGDVAFALGCTAGDYDNDGDPDLFVTNYGNSILLQNEGDGTFSKRVFSSETIAPQVGAGAAWLDFDSDGNLDLYEARYVDFTFDKDVSRKIFGVPAAPGPKGYSPIPDRLFRNDGSGNFVDVSISSGIADHAGPGMGVVAFDFDRDQDTDVFVCNDSAANFLFENTGDGKFEEIGALAGVAYGVSGDQQASMGVDLADINRDGFLDLVTTNFEYEIPNLYLNSGQGYFDDVGASHGLGAASHNVTWGISLGDLNNDSWDDCFIAAGHLIDGLPTDGANQFRAANTFLRNHRGKFSAEIAEQSPSVEVSRGNVLEDLDGDGWLDIVVLNLDSPAQILKNTRFSSSESAGNYCFIQLIGIQSSRDPAGALVEIRTGPTSQRKPLVLGRGYQSHYGRLLHFGLGESTKIDSLSVTWPDGATQEWSSLPSQNTWIIVEGSDQPIQIKD